MMSDVTPPERKIDIWRCWRKKVPTSHYQENHEDVQTRKSFLQKIDFAGILKHPYLPVALCIYAAYVVHGMGVITIAQNMSYFQARFAIDEAGVSTIISYIGLGRFICLFLFGYVSDRFGRQPMFFTGVIFYVLFFVGLIYAPSIEVACFMAFCAGAANSSFDVCCYPALMESYPKTTGTSVILVKAMISFGQMVYPLLVGFLMVEKIWYGYALVVPAALLLLVFIVILKAPFPPNSSRAPEDQPEPKDMPVLHHKSSLGIEGLCSVLFGFFSFSTFYVVVVWMPRYAQHFANMAEADALRTVSWYSIGSLICVFITASLVKKAVRPVLIMFLYSSIACATALIIFLFPSPLVCNLGSFVIGFTAAGGILQLGVSLMSEFFPKGKATVTGVYMLFSGVANFIIPRITGEISKISIKYIMLFDAALAGITAVLALILLLRFYRNFIIPRIDLRFGEKPFARTPS